MLSWLIKNIWDKNTFEFNVVRENENRDYCINFRITDQDKPGDVER